VNDIETVLFQQATHCAPLLLEMAYDFFRGLTELVGGG